MPRQTKKTKTPKPATSPAMSRERAWRIFFAGLCAVLLVLAIASVLLHEPRPHRPLSDITTPAESTQHDPVEPPRDAIRVCFAPVPESSPGGPDALLLELIQSARQSIQGAFYDLESTRIADALIAKHKGGVTVSLVSDSEYDERPAVRRCMEAGIPVVFDGRSPFMHNKFCVVDDQWVWSGSTNTTSNCFYRNNNNAISLLSAELAQNYTEEFDEMFRLRAFGSGAATSQPIVKVGTTTVECYFAPDDKPARVIIERLRDSQRTLDVMAFSFTSDEIADAMADRIAAGVHVRALFEKRNATSRHSVDEQLARAGAEVRMDGNPNNLHHKVIVMDGAVVVTGSYNFSRNAETRNDENLLIIHDTGVASLYVEEFARLWADASS